MNTCLEVLLLSIVCVYFTAAKSNTEWICTLKLFSPFQYLEINFTSGVNTHGMSSLSAGPTMWCSGEMMGFVSVQ